MTIEGKPTAAASSSTAVPQAGTPGPLPWLLRRTNQRYRAAIRERLATSGVEGIPQPGYWALTTLARGGSDASQLITEMGVSKQAISKLVDALVAAGFVARRPNRTDRRRTDLLLTAKGQRAAAVIMDAVAATQDAFVTELGAERYATLMELLTELAFAPSRPPEVP
jgi:DNA-binding MarR family transcriptional regulator